MKWLGAAVCHPAAHPLGDSPSWELEWPLVHGRLMTSYCDSSLEEWLYRKRVLCGIDFVTRASQQFIVRIFLLIKCMIQLSVYIAFGLQRTPNKNQSLNIPKSRPVMKTASLLQELVSRLMCR